MQTITFFSYKGGTGRSIAVANAARYLTRLGFKVAVMDFDLEAPGLHYKFSQAADGAPVAVERGVVDYLFSFVTEGKRPASINDYVTEVFALDKDKPPIYLIPAGKAPSVDYWQKLSRLNWHELFYGPESQGVELFLDLKYRIEDEITPDFLLIDSRTGVTEMGGVATTILPDTIIYLLLYNRENLDGARAVLRSLKRSMRQIGDQKVKVFAALGRLPELGDYELESKLLGEVRVFLEETADNLEDTLALDEIFVLHSEPVLQLRESLRVGTEHSPDDSILLQDYLRLFSHIVPKDMIMPRIDNLAQAAKEKIWCDPEGATKEMENLAEVYGTSECLREVLMFYNVRSIKGLRALKMAQRFWTVTQEPKDLLLRRTVAETFEVPSILGSSYIPDLNFIESVWRAWEEADITLGRKLAESYG
ncbi:MAG: hypothetical protein HQK57_13160, partial [Deltaproteobacteria bacterium]|nr:hypothetical protein [Deltaproteobacteria bacterium]